MASATSNGTTTILSIDGGGIRGLVPAQSLRFLENILKIKDGPQVRVADYFDVIAGTSTGGLMSGMLASPDKHNRPIYTANKIYHFYRQNCPVIFPPPKYRVLEIINNLRSLLIGPKYSGHGLQQMIENLIPEVRLSDTITNLVIPTYDIKLNQPQIFSTFEARRGQLNNPLLKDVLIGTSAAPTYLPSHGFEIYDESHGIQRNFNLIDGGIVANNPTLVAINEVAKEWQNLHSEESNIKPRILVLSLGTGKVATEGYDATVAAEWGILDWLRQKGGRSPLVDAFMCAQEGLLDMHRQTLLGSLCSDSVYLRIQERELSEDAASMDISREENLENLVTIGRKLLKKPVTSSDFEMRGVFNEGYTTPVTNKEALVKFAELLSQERKERLTSCPRNRDAR